MAAKIKKNALKNRFVSFLIIGVIILGVVYVAYVAMNGFEVQNITKPPIAVIPVQGVISLYGGGGALSAIDTVQLIEKADSDATIKAIILEINSPGGTVVASEEIANAVASANKPTVAWMREVSASGGYWVASACDKIVADPATITGSIGVTGSYLQFSELMEDYGITYERLVSGQYKDTTSQYKELTPDERALMQKKIDSINEMFVSAISENRDMAKAAVQGLATGEIFLGVEAYQKGLVDVLGGKEEAQKTAEELAGLKSSRLVEYRTYKQFQGFVMQSTSIAYWIGRGIGDAWSFMGEDETKAIKAELL